MILVLILNEKNIIFILPRFLSLMVAVKKINSPRENTWEFLSIY